MKKIIVIGCPGSGKSTLSKKLHKIMQIPLYHLDLMFWNSDKTNVGREVLVEKTKAIFKNDSWIIDGNYGSTMELRMQKCDTVIFLDYDVNVCLQGIKNRQGKFRSDMPWISSNEDETEFIEFIKNYNADSRPKVLGLLEKYKEKNIVILKNRLQADELLAKIKG